MKSNIPYNVMRHRDWDTAPRDPVTLFAFATTTLGLGTAGAALFAVGATLAITAVTSWAINALTPKPDFSSLSSQGILVNAREPAAAQDFVYGQVRKGGIVTYYETTGEKNKFLHQIVTLAGHEVEEIGDIYINDEVVTLDANGFVGGTWKDKIRVFKHDGSQTSVNDTFANSSTESLSSTLLDESELSGDDALDSNFVGNGIAYLYVRYEFDRDVFPNGVPLVTAVVKGKKVFDPRTSTIAYSNNAALCLRDYLVSSYGLNDDDIDETVFSAAANICDEAVTLDGGGTEPRYAMNGIIKSNTNHGDVLNRMVTSCAGTLFWGAGLWKLTPGTYSAPSKTLTLDDLRGPINLDTRTNLRDQFNTVQGAFNDAEQRWVTADYPPIESAAFVSEDGGVEQALDFELPLTTSAATAQRLAKLTLLRGREQMTLSADFGLNAFDVEVGEIIALDIDRYGWSGKEFEVIGWKFGPSDEGDTRITMTLRETSEDAFDWNAEESAIISNNTTLPDFADGLDILGLTVSGGGRTQGDGTFINTGIVSWTPVTNSFFDRYEVQWKPVADSDYSSTLTTDNTIEVSPLVDGVDYVFRVRAVTLLGNRGGFSTVTFTGGGDVTAPGVPTAVTAEGGFGYIAVRWTNPADTDLNFVEVYENTSNTITGATKVGVSAGDEFIRANLDVDTTRFYFLRSVDYSGNQSAFTSGVSATTTFLDDPDFEGGIYEIFKDQGLYAIEDVATLPASGDFVGQKVFNRADGNLYEWDGTAWNSVIGAENFSDLSGQITETQISDGAVTTPKVAANTITGDKIVANTITGGLLATSGIITDSAQIDNGLITNAKIANLAVDTGKIADAAIENAKIATAAVDTLEIAGNAVTIPISAVSASGSVSTGAVSFANPTPCIIMGFCSRFTGSNTFSLLINGGVVETGFSASQLGDSYCMVFETSVGSGSNTFTFSASSGSISDTMGIVVLGVQR